MKKKFITLYTEHSSFLFVPLAIFFYCLFFTGVSSCGFTANDSFCIDSSLLKHETTIIKNENTVIVSNDSIEIIHGYVTAKDKWRSGINVYLNYKVPIRLNQATVILNGWNLAFTGGSSEIQYVGAAVGNIQLERNLLTWNAVGNLKNEDDTREIEGKFYYTIILWNNVKVKLISEEGNIHDLCTFSQSGGNSFYSTDNTNMSTALASKITTLRLHDFPFRGIKAMIPRGFLMNYRDYELFDGSDFNLAQLSYNLSHVSNTSGWLEPWRMVDSAHVSWKSEFIMKDDDNRKDITMYESVSTIAGSDLGFIQPAYSILPSEDPGWFTGCVPADNGQQSAMYSIRNIPYQYAVPLLSGWNLEFTCGDEEIKSIGVYIENWTYELELNSPLGKKMTYSLITNIDDGSGEVAAFANHKVSVLGIIDITNRLRQ